MIRSMSGHGRAEAADDTTRIAVEVRSVNHRFCRVSVRLPAELGGLEEQGRRTVQELVKRGKVDVTASISGVGSAGMGLDRNAAAAWVRELSALASEQKLDPVLGVADLVQLPGVLSGSGAAGSDDTPAELFAGALAEALDNYDEMRRREGSDLAQDLRSRAAVMRARVAEIETQAAELPGRIRDQLRQRIADLLEDVGVEADSDRIVQEAAHHAERADVTEELVRLRSHLDKIDTLLETDDAVGRTLEFVTQEIHRELNTIGSKTKDLEVSDAIVDLKAELERLREQVQNIE